MARFYGMKPRDIRERSLQGFNEELKKEPRQMEMDNTQKYHDEKA